MIGALKPDLAAPVLGREPRATSPRRVHRRRCRGSEGIHRFTALVADDNATVAGLARTTSAELVRYGPGTVEYEITLLTRT